MVVVRSVVEGCIVVDHVIGGIKSFGARTAIGGCAIGYVISIIKFFPVLFTSTLNWGRMYGIQFLVVSCRAVEVLI